MRTYYRGRDALVTDEHLVWRTTSNRIFAVGELHNIGLVRGRIAGFRPVGALVIALALLAGTVTAWVAFGAAVGYSLAALTVTVTALSLAVVHQRADRVWQLQATYRGIETTLYSSTDVRVFNQVTRALTRSIQDRRPARRTYGLAAA